MKDDLSQHRHIVLADSSESNGQESVAQSLAAPAQVVPLRSGRSIVVADNGPEEFVQLRSKGGEVVLTMRLTDEGPVLSVAGVGLELSAMRNLSITCESMHIKSQSDVSLEVGGNLHEHVEGDVNRQSSGVSRSAGCEVRLEAFPGGMVLKANDDVAITGERVRLNSDEPPKPLSWDEHRARRKLVKEPELSGDAVAVTTASGGARGDVEKA